MSTLGESVESAGSEAAADESGIEPAVYVLPTFTMGVQPGIDLDRARHLDAEIEDDQVLGRAAGTL